METVALINIVMAKINNTQQEHTSVNKNPHIESASSNTEDSLVPPIILERLDKILNESLLRSKFIIIGSIIKAIIIMAKIPQEPFITEMLLVTVRNASLMEEPTRGTKLLIANLAVFIDKLSCPCANTFLHERMNINTDIVKIVTEVKVVLIVFEIPPKLKAPPKALIQAKDMQAFVRGNIQTTKKPSTIEINNIIDPFVIDALVTLPVIIIIVTMIGEKALITLHSSLKYEVTLVARIEQILNTVRAIHNPEQTENIEFIPESLIELRKQLKTDKIINRINTELKDFNTSPTPAKR